MKIDKEWALFYGIMMGDGCISECRKGKFIVVTCNVYDDKPFFNDVVVPLIEKLRGKGVTYRNREKYGKIEINFTDKMLFNKIISLGFPVGKKGKIKIPKVFERKLWKHIIAGIFATDGSLVIKNNNDTIYPRIEIRSISEVMLKQIKFFLVNKGLKGNVYRVFEKKTSSISYRLEFPGKNNLLKFKNEIGFVNPKHLRKLNLYSEKMHMRWDEWDGQQIFHC